MHHLDTAPSLTEVPRGGWFNSVLDPNSRGVASGIHGVGGRGSKIFRILGAFLNSPFYFEHFEYILLLPFIRNEKSRTFRQTHD